jgi:DNA-binding MarR family transcriptional regulator/GNAT superfamily N-acetyltransferase
MEPFQSLIEPIRAASRTIVRELGFMRPSIAGTHYPASAVHALIELDEKGETTAGSLVEILRLDKSSVSRMVGKLVLAGEVREAPGGPDKRIKRLLLTAKGRRTVAGIHAHGQRQVSAALERLSPSHRASVMQGLGAYARALAAEPMDGGGKTDSPDATEIVAGHLPGAIGRITQMHADYYARHHGLGRVFESKVAAGLADFLGRLDHPDNQLWLAVDHGRIVGSVAIDGEDLGAPNAHLRWFILDEETRGAGVGRRLLSDALAFCDERGFETTQLWTFKGLDAARSLYEQFGFALSKQWSGNQWGVVLHEQHFVRRHPSASVS